MGSFSFRRRDLLKLILASSVPGGMAGQQQVVSQVAPGSSVLITKAELDWFKKYTQAVVYMARKKIDNRFRPGATVNVVEPGGIGFYKKLYNSDYYNAVEAMVVPLGERIASSRAVEYGRPVQ